MLNFRDTFHTVYACVSFLHHIYTDRILFDWSSFIALNNSINFSLVLFFHFASVFMNKSFPTFNNIYKRIIIQCNPLVVIKMKTHRHRFNWHVIHRIFLEISQKKTYQFLQIQFCNISYNVDAQKQYGIDNKSQSWKIE